MFNAIRQQLTESTRISSKIYFNMLTDYFYWGCLIDDDFLANNQS